jgi:hypothetical protein
MLAVAASALEWALLAAAGVPPDSGLAYGAVGCAALVGIAALAKDTWDMASAFGAVACGILIGSAGLDPCTQVGLFAGPIIGCLTRVATRRRGRSVTQTGGSGPANPGRRCEAGRLTVDGPNGWGGIESTGNGS